MGQSSSLCVMPHAATLTSTSQNMGLGSGASSKTSPLIPVGSWVRMAFIISPLSVEIQFWWPGGISPARGPADQGRTDLLFAVRCLLEASASAASPGW